jgi:hypothetical protein
MRRYVLVPHLPYSFSFFRFSYPCYSSTVLLQLKTPLSHSSCVSSLANPPFVHDTSPAHVRTTHEGSASPSMPSWSSRSSSCVIEDASDMTDSLRPSFKRLPSQTLGPSNAKLVRNACFWVGGASWTSILGSGGGKEDECADQWVGCCGVGTR